MVLPVIARESNDESEGKCFKKQLQVLLLLLPLVAEAGIVTRRGWNSVLLWLHVYLPGDKQLIATILYWANKGITIYCRWMELAFPGRQIQTMTAIASLRGSILFLWSEFEIKWQLSTISILLLLCESLRPGVAEARTGFQVIFNTEYTLSRPDFWHAPSFRETVRLYYCKRHIHYIEKL